MCRHWTPGPRLHLDLFRRAPAKRVHAPAAWPHGGETRGCVCGQAASKVLCSLGIQLKAVTFFFRWGRGPGFHW